MAGEDAIADETEGAYDPFLKLVGERIRAARRRAGLKQSDLASSIGAKQPYIVAVEAGENLTLKSLARISAVLGTHPMTLLLEGELATAFDLGLFNHMGDLVRRAAQEGEQLAELLRQLQAIIPGRTPERDSQHPA
ncbi:helix-turn-helix domain-containing protein [Novosphingopyxis sp.]|uniref:helix-turn-helix domain-containing protein n=1 Tax=Novosphingopyxis sp. TaxID=2709690 RepID=UPI003B591443